MPSPPKIRKYGECPECEHVCWLDAADEPNMIGMRNRHATSTDYGPGEDWIEIWKCPECQHTFEERNGYP